MGDRVVLVMREGEGTYDVLELWPRARTGVRTLVRFVSFRSARERVLTRNIEYTPATHIPSLSIHTEHIVGGDGRFEGRT